MHRDREQGFKLRLSVLGSDESRMSVPDVSNPRVLLVTNDFGPRAGGIETFVIGLLERMPKGTVVYTSQQGDSRAYDQDWIDRHSVKVIRDRAKVLLPSPRVISQVRKVIAREGITHIWFGAAAPLAAMMLLLRRSNPSLRSIALTHGHEVWWAKILPFSLLLRVIGGSIDGIGYLTEYTKQEISRGIRPVDRSKLVQIAPGIDTDQFKPTSDEEAKSRLRRELGLEGKRIIISVGRLVHRKGQDRLIESFPVIRSHFNDAHLLLVGTGPHHDHLKRLVAKLKIHDAVTFVGRIQLADLPLYLSLAEIFAMPSRDRLAGLEVEGLGIVYLEASSCSLPVIVGRSGGAPDALIDGETGILVDGNDVDAIARSCIALLHDPSRAREMGAKGRDWVNSQWTWDRWAKEFRAALLR